MHNNKISFIFRIKYLFKPVPGEEHPDHSFYRRLFPKIIQDIEVKNYQFQENSLKNLLDVLKSVMSYCVLFSISCTDVQSMKSA